MQIGQLRLPAWAVPPPNSQQLTEKPSLRRAFTTQSLNIALSQLAACCHIPTDHFHRYARPRNNLSRPVIAAHIPISKSKATYSPHHHNPSYRNKQAQCNKKCSSKVGQSFNTHQDQTT